MSYITQLIKIALLCNTQQLCKFIKLLSSADIKAIHTVICKNILISQNRSCEILKSNILEIYKLQQNKRAVNIATNVLKNIEHLCNCNCIKHKLITTNFIDYTQYLVHNFYKVSQICINHGITLTKYLLLKFNDFNQVEYFMAFFELIRKNTKNIQLNIHYIYPIDNQSTSQITISSSKQAIVDISINDLSKQSSEETYKLLQTIETKCTDEIITHITTIVNKCKQYYKFSDPFKQITEEDIILDIAKKCDYERLCIFIDLLSSSLLKVVHADFCQDIHLTRKFLVPMRKHIPNCYLFIKCYSRPLIILVERGIMTLVCAKYMIQMLLAESTIPMHKMFNYIDHDIEKSWNHRNLKIK